MSDALQLPDSIPVDPDDGLWIPEGPGKWARPLRFLRDGCGWVELMRVDPGTRLGLHRHTGEVHAFNLRGQRRLGTGELVREGDYIHEAAGDVDWWEAIGDTPLVLFVVVMGTVEYLGQDGAVLQRITTRDRIDAYLRYCEDTGTTPQELIEA